MWFISIGLYYRYVINCFCIVFMGMIIKDSIYFIVIFKICNWVIKFIIIGMINCYYNISIIFCMCFMGKIYDMFYRIYKFVIFNFCICNRRF